MRVAIVAESFLPNVNGVTNSVLRVLEYLRRNGHEAMVIAPGSRPGNGNAAPDSYLGFPVYHVPALMVPTISSLPVGVPTWRVRRKLQEFAPEVVHLASPFVLGAAGARAARHLGIPAVGVFQTDVPGFASAYGLRPLTAAAWAVVRWIHGSCARTLAPSTATIADLQAHSIPRLYRWGRGVDTERFNPQRRSDALRRLWTQGKGGAEGKRIVGFVGRLAPEKHVERLAALHGRKDVQLVVIGDGPERAALQRLMPDAIFTGELHGDNLAQAYASLDIFVHTGEFETFCQAVQEALASGVPVLGPDAGGPKDLITRGHNGYLLTVADFEAELVAAVEELAHPELYGRLQAATRASVADRSWDSLCAQLLEHYAAVSGRAGRGAHHRAA